MRHYLVKQKLFVFEHMYKYSVDIVVICDIN